jgi:cytidine deaminase
MSTDTEHGKRPELYFGLVGPLGTDLRAMLAMLTDALRAMNYHAYEVRLSKAMRDIPAAPWSELRQGYRDDEIRSHIKAGNALRERLRRSDAMAMLGIGTIRDYRQGRVEDRNRAVEATAYIFNSLKRPEEIARLRKVYGPAFFVIAAHAPRSRRVDDLAARIAASRHANQATAFRAAAEDLVQTDEKEAANPFGQNVSDAFAESDVIIDASRTESAHKSLTRFVDKVFGYEFHTPTQDEQGMFFAHGAACRSASLARQVGAAICRSGSVLSVGTNDVPCCGGGQYWPGDPGDMRDYARGYDTSDRMRENLLADILSRLQSQGWLAADKSGVDIHALVEKALYEGDRPFMKDAHYNSTIDFVRAVHAEVAAITDAGRRGVHLQDGTLYSTTFPCHDCAKAIAAAGISRVVYIEPYPKSLIQELYGDSIAVDPECTATDRIPFRPFVGIAPKRYTEFFLTKRRRKAREGTVLPWIPATALPQFPEYMPSVAARIAAEQDAYDLFQIQMKDLLNRSDVDNA